MDSSLTGRDRRGLRTQVLSELVRVDMQIESLTRSFADIIDAAALTNTDDEHDPEGSTIAFERAQVSALLEQARRDRELLRLASEEIEQPGYGVCGHCGGFIGVERLLALPASTHCVGCAR